jgi:hypothetical protein
MKRILILLFSLLILVLLSGCPPSDGGGKMIITVETMPPVQIAIMTHTMLNLVVERWLIAMMIM